MTGESKDREEIAVDGVPAKILMQRNSRQVKPRTHEFPKKGTFSSHTLIHILVLNHAC